MKEWRIPLNDRARLSSSPCGPTSGWGPARALESLKSARGQWLWLVFERATFALAHLGPLVLFCSFTACEQDNEAAPSEPGLQMESPFEAKPTVTPKAQATTFDDPDFRLSVRAATVCEDTAPFLPSPGDKRISVPVEVVAKGKRMVPIGPLSFQLVDHEGHHYGPTLAGCGSPLESRQLEGNETAKGTVAFDVPQQAEELELQFEPFLIGRPQVTARVRVTTK